MTLAYEIENPRFSSPSQKVVSAKVTVVQDGVAGDIFEDAVLRDDSTGSWYCDAYHQLINSGDAIAPYQPPVIPAKEVKAEAQRRVYAIAPAWKQANMNARATELVYKRVTGQALSDAEVVEELHLKNKWARIEAIRATSDKIEAMTPIPQDFKDDSYWAAPAPEAAVKAAPAPKAAPAIATAPEASSVATRKKPAAKKNATAAPTIATAPEASTVSTTAGTKAE